jgi:hypothetical protein
MTTTSSPTVTKSPTQLTNFYMGITNTVSCQLNYEFLLGPEKQVVTKTLKS